jgi:hypothetical protein
LAAAGHLAPCPRRFNALRAFAGLLFGFPKPGFVQIAEALATGSKPFLALALSETAELK